MQTRMRWLAGLGLLAVAVALVGMATVPPSARDHGSGSSHHAHPALHPMHERFRLHDRDGTRFTPNADNYAERADADSPLLLFLPATRERPSNYTEFLSTARIRGFHVLALDYWNDGKSVQKTCGTDPACYTDVQRNRLDGTHPTQFSAVDPANSIVDRLADAIRHLDSSDPSGGWGRFVSRHRIDWADIVVAGHSQGGGESAYIAHIHRVLGVLMFSSPVDSDNGIDASWMSHPGATPVARMYGFDDTGDIFSARIQASWTAMGLDAFGPPDDITKGIATDAHELLTTRDLGTPMQSHSLDITDETPRLADGRPIFASVWNWMLGRLWSSAHIAIS